MYFYFFHLLWLQQTSKGRRWHAAHNYRCYKLINSFDLTDTNWGHEIKLLSVMKQHKMKMYLLENTDPHCKIPGIVAPKWKLVRICTVDVTFTSFYQAAIFNRSTTFRKFKKLENICSEDHLNIRLPKSPFVAIYNTGSHVFIRF